MLIAVASSYGKEINQHFGHVQKFMIYEVDQGGMVRFVETRGVERYCSFDPEHPLRGGVLRDTAQTLSDCCAVLCTQIGAAPRDEMERLGIQILVLDGPIDAALKEISKILPS